MTFAPITDSDFVHHRWMVGHLRERLDTPAAKLARARWHEAEARRIRRELKA